MLRLRGTVSRATEHPKGWQASYKLHPGPAAVDVDTPHQTYAVDWSENRLVIYEQHIGPQLGVSPEHRKGSWLELRPDTEALELITDRIGTIPVYLASTRSGALIASRLTDLAAALPNSPQPNASAVAMMVFLEYCWGPETLLDGVELLPPASTCRLYPDGRIACERYWEPPPIPRAPEGRITDWVEASVHTLQAAHTRHATGLAAGAGLALPVTAGLDSRCNLALHRERLAHARLFHCHDLGRVELPYARKIAAYLGQELDLFDSADAMRFAPQFDVGLGPGDFNIGHWRLVGSSERLAETGATATIDGFLQDLLFKATFLRDAPRAQQVQAHIGRARYNAAALGLEERGRPVRRCLEAVEAHYPSADTGLDASQRHYLENRSRRLIYNIVRLNQNYLDVRTPALDPELMDFGLSVPWELRRNSTLYRHVIDHLDQGLAAIPYDKTGLPLLDPRPRSRAKALARTVRPYLDALWPGRPFLQRPEGNFARLARRDERFRTSARSMLEGSEWLKATLELQNPADILGSGSRLGQASIDCLGGMLTVAAVERHIHEHR